MRNLFFVLVGFSIIGITLYPLHALALTSLGFFLIKYLYNDELDFKSIFKFDDNGVHDHPFISKKPQPLTESKKRVISIHESGHLLVLWFSPEIEFNQCEIAIHDPTEGKGPAGSTLERDITEIHDKRYMLAKIAVSYGSHILEKKHGIELHDGHGGDMGFATKIANEMVTELGMSERFPNMNLLALNGKFMTANAKDEIQNEIKKMLQQGMGQAIKIIEEHLDKSQHLINALCNQPLSTPIKMPEIEKILGPRPQRQ